MKPRSWRKATLAQLIMIAYHDAEAASVDRQAALDEIVRRQHAVRSRSGSRINQREKARYGR
ncbi:hypothetical protein SAMN05216312_102178 [Cohnella sp. OV330]|nr:hypothetical protein SAMN05216312_102178 [Cohnella sp. OV330]